MMKVRKRGILIFLFFAAFKHKVAGFETFVMVYGLHKFSIQFWGSEGRFLTFKNLHRQIYILKKTSWYLI